MKTVKDFKSIFTHHHLRAGTLGVSWGTSGVHNIPCAQKICSLGALRTLKYIQNVQLLDVYIGGNNKDI